MTVVDGEVVALDDSGRPSFNLLQNFGSGGVPIFYYVFDVLVLAGRDVRSEPLRKRRELLQRHILPKLKDPIREYPQLNAGLSEIIDAVRAQGLEGVVAKNLNSLYEPGRRSGVWRKMRINQGQEFVIRRVYAGRKVLRCGGVWLLRGRKASVRRQDTQRVHSPCTRTTPKAFQWPRNSRVPICKLAGEEIRPVGPWSNRREDEGLSLAETGASRQFRVRGIGA